MWKSESYSSSKDASRVVKVAARTPSRLEWALPTLECDTCRRQETKKTMKLFKNIVYRKKTSTSSSSATSSSNRSSTSSSLKLQTSLTSSSLGEYNSPAKGHQHHHSHEYSHSSPQTRSHQHRHSQEYSMPSTRARQHQKHLSTPAASSRPQRPTIHGRAVSNGPYCMRRPGLTEILADKAPSPWSLASFKEYCLQNMCLENLEFTIDAKQYQTLYEQVYTAQSDGTSAADATALHHLKVLWKSIINSYITRNGVQEINLPAVIRDNLLLVPESQIPPPPEVLSPAIAQIHTLMEDSILLPFLNDTRPASASRNHMDLDFTDERALKTRSMFVETSTTPASLMFPPAFAEPGPSSDLDLTSGSLPLARAVRPKSSLMTKHSHSSSTTSMTGDPGLTDDNVSFTTRTTADTNEAISPPRTPPTSTPQASSKTSTHKVKSSGSSGSGTHLSSSASESWKRMGSKLGFRSSKKGQSRQYY